MGEERQREKEENHFISNSDQRPRHAEENHQNFSPPRCEPTIRVTLREAADVRYRRADSPQPESIHSLTLPPLGRFTTQTSSLGWLSSVSGDNTRLTEFQKPALPVRVEEGVCQVVPIILGDLKGLIFNTLVQILQEKLGY